MRITIPSTCIREIGVDNHENTTDSADKKWFPIILSEPNVIPDNGNEEMNVDPNNWILYVSSKCVMFIDDDNLTIES